MAQDRIGLETLKLLVSVAWADHEIAVQETEHLRFLLEQMGTTEAETEFIQQALRDEGRLPAPDLSLLREHRPEVMASVDILIGIDERIATNEVAIRKAIELMLAPAS